MSDASDATADPVVGVVGLGHIGGSIARAVVSRGGRVVATTRKAETREAAQEFGVEIVNDIAGVVAAADIVVLAVPLPVLETTMTDVAAAVNERGGAGPAPTVTDVGSVKGSVAAHGGQIFGSPSTFVPGHPMAGTELAGWEAADADLFVSRRWALVADSPVVLERWADVARLAIGLGSEVVPVSADVHDRVVALVSHLPYAVAAVVAQALMTDPDAELARSLAAGSFTDLTRVAGGHPELGAQMALANRVALHSRLTQTAADLVDLADALAHTDPSADRVNDTFTQGFVGRRALDRRRAAGPDDGRGAYRYERTCDREELIEEGRRGHRVVGIRGDMVDGADRLGVEIGTRSPDEPEQ